MSLRASGVVHESVPLLQCLVLGQGLPTLDSIGGNQPRGAGLTPHIDMQEELRPVCVCVCVCACVKCEK